MNLISETHHSCERREYTFMILQEYLIIFHFSLPKMNLTSSSTFLLVHDPDFDFFSKDRKKVDEEICPLNRLGPSLLDMFWLGLHSLKSTLVLKLSSILYFYFFRTKLGPKCYNSWIVSMTKAFVVILLSNVNFDSYQ